VIIQGSAGLVDSAPVAGDRPGWLSLRTLLILVLVVWNGYFLAALIYEQFIKSPAQSTVSAIIVWLWVLGDAAILLCSWALRTILRGRRTAA
jgi:hypothetical protein